MIRILKFIYITLMATAFVSGLYSVFGPMKQQPIALAIAFSAFIINILLGQIIEFLDDEPDEVSV